MTASLLGQQGWTQDVGWAECGSLVIETLRRTTVVIRQHQAEPEVIKGPFYPWDESLFSWLFCLCAYVLVHVWLYIHLHADKHLHMCLYLWKSEDNLTCCFLDCCPS